VTEEEDEMAYVTRRFQKIIKKHGGFQKKASTNRAANANDHYNKFYFQLRIILSPKAHISSPKNFRDEKKIVKHSSLNRVSPNVYRHNFSVSSLIIVLFTTKIFFVPKCIVSMTNLFIIEIIFFCRQW